MLEFTEPKFEIGTEERQDACQDAMRSAMHAIIRSAIQHGWLEAELTMALADVAEDHTIALASNKLKPSIRLVSTC